jgi:hypothetical protein
MPVGLGESPQPAAYAPQHFDRGVVGEEVLGREKG